MVSTKTDRGDRVFRLHGELQGEQQVFVLGNGDNPVGADPVNPIHIPVRQVSRRHAVLRVERDGVRLEDLDSTNGSYVNGVRVRKARLGDNDWVQFGPVLMTFRAAPAEENVLAIDLGKNPPGPVAADFDDRTTEIGIAGPTTIAWGKALERCASWLISRWEPDLEKATRELCTATGSSGVALVTWSASGPGVVVAATGDLSALDPWLDPVGRSKIRDAGGDDASLTSARLASDPPTSAAVSWREDRWESALFFVGADIRAPERPFLELALRMFQSATIPVLEDGSARATANLGHDLEFPDWHVVGHTQPMETLYKQLSTLGAGNMPVLVTGETGVGKEHIVRILHDIL